MNVIIAVLILRNIITEDEGQRIVDFIHDRPQSKILTDAIADVAEIIGKSTTPALPVLGPVGPAQIADTLANHRPDPLPVVEVEKTIVPTPVKKSTDKPIKK